MAWNVLAWGIALALLCESAPAMAQMGGRTMTRDQFFEMVGKASGGAHEMKGQVQQQRRQMMEQSMGKEAAEKMLAEEDARRQRMEMANRKVISTCLGVSESTMDRLSEKFEGTGRNLMASAQGACRHTLPEMIEVGPSMEATMAPYMQCAFEAIYGEDAKKEGITFEKMQRCSAQTDRQESLETRMSRAGGSAEKAALRELEAAQQGL
jgi:hypothetical protein